MSLCQHDRRKVSSYHAARSCSFHKPAGYSTCATPDFEHIMARLKPDAPTEFMQSRQRSRNLTRVVVPGRRAMVKKGDAWVGGTAWLQHTNLFFRNACFVSNTHKYKRNTFIHYRSSAGFAPRW